MLRVEFYTKRKWKNLKTMNRLRVILGPNGLFIRWSLTTICPVILSMLLIASIVNYERVYFAGRTIPVAYESVAWITMTAPLIIIPICAIQTIIRTRRNGKMLSSLFDTSQWSQESKENSEIEHQPSFPCTSEPRRENTYMYIDPASRGPTIRSCAVPAEENYGWRTGRLKECQDNISLAQSPSQPSFAASFASQATANGELNLFGSPPLSNAFMISDAITIRTKVRKRNDKNSSRTHNVSPSHNAILPANELQMEQMHSSSEQSEPMFKVSSSSNPPSHCTSTPLPRTSPCRSEPPLIRTEGAKSQSQRSKSESHDEHEADSDDDDEYGIRRQRVTVIRRFRSEDSFQAQSTGSISITPVDIVRQRSLSSVAIYDDQRQARPTQTLSQLKRPAPIDAPTRF
uniref:Uncharacterized protein n=1 Tax=Heterorhabditis bacteriophora TaxID=37862 RepID=A0A1I7XT23_HETBA